MNMKPDARIKELCERLTSPGPIAEKLSASEHHELVEFIMECDEADIGCHLSEDKISAIASNAAHNVCEAGSPNAANHNTATIVVAIRAALDQATVVTIRRARKPKK